MHNVVKIVERDDDTLALLVLDVRRLGDDFAIFAYACLMAGTNLLTANLGLIALELHKDVVATIGRRAVILHAPTVGGCLKDLLGLGNGIGSTL